MHTMTRTNAARAALNLAAAHKAQTARINTRALKKSFRDLDNIAQPHRYPAVHRCGERVASRE